MIIGIIFLFFILFAVIYALIASKRFSDKILEMIEDVKEINHNIYEIAKFLEETHNEGVKNKN